jgi:hypothetical protein
MPYVRDGMRTRAWIALAGIIRQNDFSEAPDDNGGTIDNNQSI